MASKQSRVGDIKGSTQQSLDRELRRLKALLPGLPQALKVSWIPNMEKALCGEVKGQEIFIYEPGEGEALKTLRHEAVDILVSEALAPYRALTNALIKTLNEEAYRRKEKAVSSLTSILDDRSKGEE